MSELRHTPLSDWHRAAGARLVPFAGWEMPVQFEGVLQEHQAVRQRAGLFDVSHMGELRLRGQGTLGYLEAMTPNRVASLTVGQAHYSGLLNEAGGFLDDLLVYRLDEEEFLLVVNAANKDADLRWLLTRAPSGIEVLDETAATALLALQGPKAGAILAVISAADLAAITYYRFTRDEVAGVGCLISRTGYTGEDGFELYCDASEALPLWRALLAAGESEGLIPAGLGARNTLRLEAGMALHGHEIDDETTPLEAGLGWMVKLKKGPFVGSEALAAQKRDGVPRELVGLRLEGRRIAREGEAVAATGKPIGRVTSGSFSPTLEVPIAMALIERGVAAVGDRVTVEIRNREETAEVVELPFYRRDRG